MNNKQKPLLRLLAILMMLATFIGCFATTASALTIGDPVTFYHRIAYRGGQQSGEGDEHAPGKRDNHYQNRPYWYNGWKLDVITLQGSGLKAQYDGKTYAYCIQHGAKYEDENRFVEATGNDFYNSKYWESLDQSKRTLLQRLMAHCFPAKTPAELGVSSVDDSFAAGQIIIWEIIAGYRDAKGNLVNTTLRDQYLKYTYTGYGHTAGEDTPAMTAYNNIVNSLVTHSVKPSWDKGAITLSWNDTNNRYEGTITDRNNVLGQFTIPSTVGSVNLSRSGNTLTLWSTTAIDESVTLTLNKALKRAADTGALAIFGGNSEKAQKMMYGQLDDPVSSTLEITTDSGSMALKKLTTVPGGTVANIVFSIESSTWNGGVPKQYTTDSQGKIDVDLPIGTYIVREVTTFDNVEQPAPQTVVVKKGKVTSVRFTNKPAPTTFKVRKFDPVYGNIANIPFRIEHTGESNTAYNWYYRGSTNAEGEMEITTEAVNAYYQHFIDSYTGATARAQAIYRDVFGKTDYDTDRMDVITRALLTVSSGQELRVISATYDAYELLWAFPSNGVPAEYYEGWHDTTDHELYDSINIDVTSTNNLLEFENWPAFTTWIVKKTSEDGVVNGIPFLVELLSPEGDVLSSQRMTTAARTIKGTLQNGVIFANIASTGTWRFTELECEANGYVAQEPQTVTLAANTETTITFKNWVSTVPTTLQKTSDSGNVAGYTFRVFGTTDWGETVSPALYTTDDEGKITALFKPGTYTFEEILTEEQAKLYELPAPQTITIRRGQASASVFFHNSYKPVPVRAIKTSDSGNVEGFILSCVGESDTGLPVDMTDLVTDENGYVDLLLYPGTYVWSEHLTEEQAKLYAQPAPQTITVLPGQEQVTVSFHNAYAPVPVTLTKTSTNGVVDGFAFSLYNSKTGALITKDLMSHDGGKIEIKNADGTYSPVELLPGTYYLYENLTDEQKKVYVTPTAPAYITVSEGSTSVSATFKNTTKEVTLYLYKYTEDMTNLGGFHFTLSEVTDAGNTILYDDLVSDNYGTIRRGDGSYPVALPGTYTLTEVLTPEQAQVYQQLEPITFTLTDSHVSVGYTRSITNKYIPGEISVVKQDRSGNTLAGAEYLLQISTDNGKTWNPVSSSQCSSVGLADGKLVTGEDGVVSFEGLKVNESTLYRLTETKAPEGCSLLTAPIFEGTLPMLGSSGLTRTPSFTVTDDVVLSLPHTGGNGFIPVVLTSTLCGLLATAFGVWLWINRRKATDITG